MVDSDKEELKKPILSQEEKDKIKKEALAELEAENKKKAENEYKEQIKQEAKKKATFKDAKPGEGKNGLIPVFIDLPRSAEVIRLDGTVFYPGRTYNVKPDVADVLFDIMHRTAKHEDEIRGNGTDNFYRKKTHSKI